MEGSHMLLVCSEHKLGPYASNLMRANSTCKRYPDKMKDSNPHCFYPQNKNILLIWEIFFRQINHDYYIF